VRVILADGQLIVRSALRLLLTTRTPHAIIVEAATADELLAQVNTGEPDLILLDWELPGAQPAALLSQFRERWPAITLVVFGRHPDIQTEAWQAGAAFFVSKTSLPDEVLAVLDRFSGNKQYES
jgi:DNA-binding NarL/FixJ family response regulator